MARETALGKHLDACEAEVAQRREGKPGRALRKECPVAQDGEWTECQRLSGRKLHRIESQCSAGISSKRRGQGAWRRKRCSAPQDPGLVSLCKVSSLVLTNNFKSVQGWRLLRRQRRFWAALRPLRRLCP